MKFTLPILCTALKLLSGTAPAAAAAAAAAATERALIVGGEDALEGEFPYFGKKMTRKPLTLSFRDRTDPRRLATESSNIILVRF